MTDERKAPLYFNGNADTPADFKDLRVRFNDVERGDELGNWLEVDVLGMWGVRLQTDKNGYPIEDGDGCFLQEKVYGKFELRYAPVEKPAEDIYKEAAEAIFKQPVTRGYLEPHYFEVTRDPGTDTVNAVGRRCNGEVTATEHKEIIAAPGYHLVVGDWPMTRAHPVNGDTFRIVEGDHPLNANEEADDVVRMVRYQSTRLRPSFQDTLKISGLDMARRRPSRIVKNGDQITLTHKCSGDNHGPECRHFPMVPGPVMVVHPPVDLREPVEPPSFFVECNPRTEEQARDDYLEAFWHGARKHRGIESGRWSSKMPSFGEIERRAIAHQMRDDYRAAYPRVAVEFERATVHLMSPDAYRASVQTALLDAMVTPVYSPLRESTRRYIGMIPMAVFENHQRNHRTPREAADIITQEAMALFWGHAMDEAKKVANREQINVRINVDTADAEAALRRVRKAADFANAYGMSKDRIGQCLSKIRISD